MAGFVASCRPHAGVERARFLLTQLRDEARRAGAMPAYGDDALPQHHSPGLEAKSPGNRELEHKIRAAIRWNAVAIILRANKESSELGGHIASFQSSAPWYDIGFGHFWHAPTADHGGDLIYVQGHVSPGIYARAFVEGRLTEQQLLGFRQESDGKGIPSYPHPWLMPDFWQFPTVSMDSASDGDLPGALPQATRGARPRKDREPQGVGVPRRRRVRRAGVARRHFARRPRAPRQPDLRDQLQPAAPRRTRARQRQDHPGIGRRVPRRGLERHQSRVGLRLGHALREGQGRHPARAHGRVRGWPACPGLQEQERRVREHFFNSPELKALVADLSDEQVWKLNRGGHDPFKVYAAYAAAVKHKDQPTVILAKTVKGFGMGESGEGQMIAHQAKKMTADALKQFRDRFDIPMPDDKIEAMPSSRCRRTARRKHLQERAPRSAVISAARASPRRQLVAPPLSSFERLLQSSGDRKISTTMAFVQMLGTLLRDKTIGKHIVPIVPDESRTFGMEGMFRQLGIYSAVASSTSRRTPTSSSTTVRTSRGRCCRKASTRPAR